MTNEELAMEIQRDHDRTQNLARLYDLNRGMIDRIALELAGNGIEEEDLCQEAFFGLARAADLWDPAGGATFLNYATYWIRQAMIRHIEKCGSAVRIPSNQRTRIRKCRRFGDDFQKECGRLPSEEETAAALGLTAAQVRQVKRDERILSMKSLDAPLPGGELDGLTLGDAVENPLDYIGETDDRIRQELLAGHLWKAVDDLSPRQAFVLHHYYGSRETFAMIGRLMHTTGSWARVLHNRAIRNLQKQAEHDGVLWSFWDEADEATAYHPRGIDTYQRTRLSITELTVFQRVRRDEMAASGLN